MDKKDVIRYVFKGLTFVLGVFLLALNFNLLLKPNDLVVGSMSGLSLILENTIGIDSTLFIYASSLILLFVSFFLLGAKTTSNTIIGSILYPIMVSSTAPIADFITNYLQIDEFIIVVVLAGIFYGVSNGLIYKVGYSTGGGDVVMQLLSKYLNVPTAKANVIYSFLIVLASGFVFGWVSFIYAIIVLVVSNVVINKILVGVSNSKVFFISSNKGKELKEMINAEFSSGFTILSAESGYSRSKKHKELIMVAISTRNYYPLKNRVLDIDPEAFFVINDCYEVNGGMRKPNIPFF